MRQFKPTIERFTVRNKSFDIFAKDLKKATILEKKELNKLVIQYQQTKCPKALDKITKSLLRFLVSVSNSYAGVKGSITSVTDLTSTAYEGMHEALEKFDASKGFCFSSYAVWWIRQRILYSIQKIDIVVKPYSRTIKGVKQFKEYFYDEYGIEPTDHEISMATGASILVLNGLRKTRALSFSYNRGSDDNPLTIEDTYKDTSYMPGENLANEDNKKIVKRLLDRLPPIQRKIIQYHFGIGLDRAYNLEEIGKMIGRTREAVRLRKNKALQRLAILAKK